MSPSGLSGLGLWGRFLLELFRHHERDRSANESELLDGSGLWFTFLSHVFSFGPSVAAEVMPRDERNGQKKQTHAARQRTTWVQQGFNKASPGLQNYLSKPTVPLVYNKLQPMASLSRQRTTESHLYNTCVATEWLRVRSL